MSMSKEIIGKKSFPPGTVLAPVPALMVSCGQMDGVKNIITVAWVGTVCSDPPMVGVGIRPSRYSHELISARREFVLNIPGEEQLEATDYCGAVSGRKVDKFQRTGLTPVRGESVEAPLIKECPVNLECKVREILQLGAHDLFLGEILRVHKSEGYEDADGMINTFAYGSNKRYYSLGKVLGVYGFAAKKF